MFPWAAAIGAIGQWYLSGRAASAEREGYEQLMAMLAPSLAMAQRAMGLGMGGAEQVMNYFGSRLGKPSPELTAQHVLNVSRIGRSTEAAKRGSQALWEGRGNVGRAAGDVWRSDIAGQSALGEEATGYLGAQEKYKLGTASGMGSAAGTLMGGGTDLFRSVLGPAASSIMGMGQAKAGYFGDIAGALGDLVGSYEGQQELYDILKALKKGS